MSIVKAAPFKPLHASHHKALPSDPECPFPVGVEYYRPPVPPREFWDEDLARIRAAGMTIVRTFPYWNWIEPAPGEFRFDDFDYLFELAHKHSLKIWFDTPAGTHGACPEWLIRLYPDMRVVRQDGSVQHPSAGNYAPQGGMIHNFDHPKWREHTEQYVRAVVSRYKDHPSMLIWGTWDGINFAAAWLGGEDYPPYNDYTIEKYRVWLKDRFTLDELNEQLLRRYTQWEDVDAPRSKVAIVETLLYLRFHYENMADHLGWMADLIDQIDGKHEQRSHGAHYPRQWDEITSQCVDSWGLSMPSAGMLTADDPYTIADHCLGFRWCRAVGRDGRWWNEEIYSGSTSALRGRTKQSTPEEATLFLWLSLIEGSAGALYWQYRPEYMSFEAPGLNLISLDGTPLPRWHAVAQAISRIHSISSHLPLEIPQAEMALAYSALSNDVFWCNSNDDTFLSDLLGVHRTLWAESVPCEIVSPAMDWSAYRVVYLPHCAVLDETAISRIRSVLEDDDGPNLIADGYFGTFSGKGHWSYQPPEGLSDLVDIGIVDVDMITNKDIREGRNVLKTDYGEFPVSHECPYVNLTPKAGSRVIATLGEHVVGAQTADGKLTWFGLSLSRAFGGAAPRELLIPLLASLGCSAPLSIEGDKLIALQRESRSGGDLIFLLNLEQKTARARIVPERPLQSAHDLLEDRKMQLTDGALEVEVPHGGVSVVHCVNA